MDYVTLDAVGGNTSEWSESGLTLANIGVYADIALGERGPGESDVFEPWTVSQWREIVMAEMRQARVS